MKRIALLTIVVLLFVASLAQAAPGRKYLRFGRNPVDRDGVQQSELKDDQTIVSLPYDAPIKMRGASGEWVSGLAPAGTLMVARLVTTETSAGTIYSYRAEKVQVCGNPVETFYFPAPAPPCKPAPPKIEYRDREVIRDQYWEVNETTTVERTELALVYTSMEEKPLPSHISKYTTQWVEGYGKTILRGGFLVGAAAARKPDRTTMVQQQATALAFKTDFTSITDVDTTTNTQVGVETGVVVDNN